MASRLHSDKISCFAPEPIFKVAHIAFRLDTQRIEPAMGAAAAAPVESSRDHLRGVGCQA